ncbi:Major facilitator-type transporter ecdD like protein [Verticillium longisporum]|uniref:Major facilitator-type transporter ecdD like protein n=1 Tax=Verticillium longisporum TaxID=100787 RepID=A0A8I3AU31_VERLO|nr:Major facilitator-type transporter ecdD like protein [Verticillium longisporum]
MSAQTDKIEAGPRSGGAEHHDNDIDLKHEAVVLKSDHDELGLWATVCRFKKVAVLICNLIAIAAAADGYQYKLNGNIIANKGFVNHIGFLNAAGTKHVLNAQHTALWGAMQSLGQLVGMLFLNPVSDRIGRKMTMYVLWVVLAGSLTLETLVRDWRDWSGAKILAGVGVGALQSTLPIYIAEWSPSNIRGAMVLTYSFWNTIGKFLAPLTLLICENADPQEYKIPIVTQWGFLGIMLPIFLWLPETAQYYAERDLDEKGRASLDRVNGRVPGYDVDAEYAIIKNSILEQRRRRQELEQDDGSSSSRKGWRELADSYVACFRGPNARRTLGSALPACAQQLTGLSFLSTYASLFFRQAGFADPFLITTVLTAIALVTSVALMLWTDRFGRRLVVFAAACVSTATMLVVAVIGLAPTSTPLRGFCIFVACVWSFFNNALGAHGRAGGRPGADMGYQTGWLFFGVGAVTCVVVWFFVPEPSRRNNAEMDEMYDKGVPAWKMKDYVTDVQLAQRQARGRREEVA